MLNAGLSIEQSTPLVGVRTTTGRGFTPEELAVQCTQKIISVSDTAPPAIRDQAIAYQKSVEQLVARYLKQAVLSDRTTVYNALNDAGHAGLAELIRKL